jgi:Rieske Fe-S protein
MQVCPRERNTRLGAARVGRKEMKRKEQENKLASYVLIHTCMHTGCMIKFKVDFQRKANKKEFGKSK